MGKGGGGSPAPQTSTVNQSNLPEYARPYFEDLLQRGQTASQVQYQPYRGERTAGFSPLQEQGFQGVQGLGPSALNAPAAGLTGVAGLGGLGAGQNYAQQATSPGSMQAYMSPYMQNVVDFQKSQAIQDYGRQLPGQQAAASRAGAFGGSRQAIVESEAQRNLQGQLGGIQAQGSQQAFEQANKNLQFGSQLGLQGLGLAGQMGQQLGQLGQTAFGQQAAAAQAQQAAGATQQAQSQDILNKRYEDFMQQQTFPQSQLQFYSSLLRGVPVSPNQTMYQYQAPASAASQVAGLGMGALGLSRAFGARDGGAVPGYAEGGITGGPEGQPTTLEVSKIKTALLKGADPRSFPPSIALLLAVSDPRVKDAIDTREGAKAQAALDQGRQNAQLPSIMEEQMAQLGPSGGIAGLDMGAMEDAEYGGGGIIAFNGGGAAFSAQDIVPEDIEEARRNQGRTPFIDDSPKERAARFRAAQQARAASAGLSGATEAAGNTPSLFSRGLGALRRVAARGAGGAGLMIESADAGAGSDVVPGKPAGRPPTQQEVNTMLERGEISDTKAREMLRKSLAAPAAPQAQYDAQGRQEGRGQPAGPFTGGSKTAIPPAQPAATPGQSIKPETSLLYTGETPKAAFTRKEAEMEERFPSEMKDRLEELKAQGQQAVKDRDADRWLAVAMGGFAAAAGESPFALKNFAQGLGLTTKEIASVNKDFRKSEDLRKQIEREERKANRLEGMQKYTAADTARTRVEDITRQAQQADAMYKARLEELAIKQFSAQSERDIGLGRNRILASAAEQKSGLQKLENQYAQLLKDGKTADARALLPLIREYYGAVGAGKDPLKAAFAETIGGGGGGGRGVVDFGKLPSQQKQ